MAIWPAGYRRDTRWWGPYFGPLLYGEETDPWIVALNNVMGETVAWFPVNWEVVEPYGWGQWWERWKWHWWAGWMLLRDGEYDGYPHTNGIYYNHLRFVVHGQEPW